MKRVAFFILIILVLSACLPAATEPALVTTMPTLVVPTQETAVPTPIAETTPIPDSTETPLPATATAGATAVPGSDAPMLITRGSTNVRLGPGLSYGVSHVLPGGATVPLIGKNLNGTWWAVAGPGDGPGPAGWVSAAVVDVGGDLDNVPFMSAPTLTPTPSLPVMGNTGPPPGDDTCVAAHPGPNDGGPTLLHQAAGEAFPVVAQLGLNRWAEVTGVQHSWHRLRDATGIAGWVHQSRVSFSGRCSDLGGAPGSDPGLPLIENPGAPPATHCVASRPGQFPPPGIHLGPGRQFALTARLGNWAEILKSENGWRQILLGPGQVGWVSDEDVELTGEICPATQPAPGRIQFEPGAISAIVDGALHPPRRDRYLFRAEAGQHVIIEIHSTEGRANFMLNGVEDGQPYKRLEDERRLWGADLPLTQDYLLTVAAPAEAPFTEYSVEVLIRPLDTSPPPSIGMEIASFAVTADPLPDNGRQLTFQWETSGGASARIRSGSAQRFQPIWDVPLSGETTVDVPQTLFRDPAMTLELFNEAGEFISESIVVDWECTNAYFFTPQPRLCPHPAATIPAALQPFERGWLVWLENVDGDGQDKIIALYADGTLQSFIDTWGEGDPVDDPALQPPPGLFQPTRGFGEVWREQSGVRERLGWAASEEGAFQATLQKEMVESIPSLGYLQLVDGRILYLPLGVPSGAWEQIN